ncbi:L-amino acid N-acyltransferase YncA [Planctomycetales bacterium 10988]|nr:L-amino acid N-acyltransferase YncA [Planctomycetales bacterium 10988]
MQIVTAIPNFTLRHVREDEIPILWQLIGALADYERTTKTFKATESDLQEALFGEYRNAEAVFACEDEDIVGFALFFPKLSTFLGKPALYVEDIYLKPNYRGRGYGREIFRFLAHLARKRKWGRLEWSVMDWNEPAIRFYQNLGAVCVEEWQLFRLQGSAMDRLADTFDQLEIEP